MILHFFFFDTKIQMIIKSYVYEVSLNRYSNYIYIYYLKLNDIPYKIHTYVNFEICIENVLRPEYFNFEICIEFLKMIINYQNYQNLTLKIL